MKNSVLIKTLKTAFMVCPIDCLFMTIVQIVTTLMPTFVLLLNKSLIRNMSDSQSIIIIICILLLYCFVLFLQRFLVNWYNHYFLTYNSLLRFEKKIKRSLFEICNRMNLLDYNDPEIENATRRAKNASINILRVYQAVGEIFSAMIGAISVSFVICEVNYMMAVIMMLLGFSSIVENLFMIYQNKKLLYKNTQLEREEEECGNLLLKPNSLKEIKSLNCVEYVFSKWKNIISRLKNTEKRKNVKVLLFSIGVAILSLSGQITAYAILFNSYLTNKIGIAEFSISITAFNSINGLIRNMFEVLGGMGQFLVMVKPYFDFKNLFDVKENNVKIQKPEDHSICLQNVYFQYPGSDEYTLKNINMKVLMGKKIAIIGENGSGKTTLLHLILNQFSPTKGNILYNGIDYNQISEQVFFDNVSVVPQQFNCYSISIKDNISFGKYISNEQLKALLKPMHLIFLDSDENTSLGREFGGIELSGGQKQRVAILRAKFKQAKILAFDEPTSAIDPFQEKEIYDQLLTMMDNKMVFVISHRLALCKDCDQILVMKDGEIVESGTHSELIRKKDIYYKMWNIQAALYK